MKILMLIMALLSLEQSNSQTFLRKNISTEVDGKNKIIVDEITIFNSTYNFICVPLSTTFYDKGMIDTITLALRGDSDIKQHYFSLELSKEDKETNFNSIFNYPLFIAPRTSVLLKIKMVQPASSSKTWLEVKYSQRNDFNIYDMLDKFKKKKQWLNGLVFSTHKIFL